MTKPEPGVPRPALCGAACVVFLLLCTPAWSLTLTGVLQHGIDESGEPVGPVWRTGRPHPTRMLGFTRWPLPGIRGIPLGNEPSGEVEKLLLPGSHITTLFWQFFEGEFPNPIVLNLYFDGAPEPRISAIVPFATGFTGHRPNELPFVLALDRREVENTAGLFYDDGKLRAELRAAFYFPSEGGGLLWRPADLFKVDRVGEDTLSPDGFPDGVTIFELVVLASPRARSPVRRPPARSGFVAPRSPRGPAAQSAEPHRELPPPAISQLLPVRPPREGTVTPRAKPRVRPSPLTERTDSGRTQAPAAKEERGATAPPGTPTPRGTLLAPRHGTETPGAGERAPRASPRPSVPPQATLAPGAGTYRRLLRETTPGAYGSRGAPGPEPEQRRGQAGPGPGAGFRPPPRRPPANPPPQERRSGWWDFLFRGCSTRPPGAKEP